MCRISPYCDVIFDTLRPRQNGRHFADDTFKRIFLNENVLISINISLKFVPKVPINNIPTLVQIMAWRRSGDKPLSELMMIRLTTHIWVTRPQWGNSLAPGRSEYDSKNVIFNLVLLIDIFRSSHNHALRWMPQELPDDNSILVRVMAWCREATSHYLSQCWLNSLSPYGAARPKWVNTLRPRQNGRYFADDIFKRIFMNFA